MNKKVKKNIVKYTLEFFVIVLGISISFWINEWNSLRNVKKLERAYLININTEFKDNKIQFDKRLRFMNRTYNIGKNFIKQFPISNKNSDSIFDGIFGKPPYLSIVVSFDPSSSSIKSLINSPSFSKMSNLKLKKHITEWSDLVLDYKEEEGASNQVSNEIIQFHKNTTSLNYKFEGRLSKDDINKLEKLIYWKTKKLSLIVDSLSAPVKLESSGVMESINAIITLTEPYLLLEN
jgi:hypothetical protein